MMDFDPNTQIALMSQDVAMKFMVCRFSASKLAVLYAYELLFKNDEEAAQTYRGQLMQKQDSFASPGETKTALELCDVIYSRK